MNLVDKLPAYQRFCGTDLTSALCRIESDLRGVGVGDLARALGAAHATKETITAAGQLKRVAGQVNVVIHAVGILLCLPHILEAGETVECLSLGAGNAGRPFDLETSRRVAEFKFITWRGGSETIRQNSLFKDFFGLAEHSTHKSKHIYLLETARPLRFLNGRRALKSVLKDARLANEFWRKYPDQYQTVGQYFRAHASTIELRDISEFLPGLSEFELDAEESALP